MQLVKSMKKVFLGKDFAFFDGRKPFNLNIIGVRSENRKAGRFDDIIMVIYRNQIRDWQVLAMDATVDSGIFYLKRPLNRNGTAVMLPGQYRGAYKLGIHGRTWVSGGYEALEQVKPMLYYRDNNKDDLIDIDEAKAFEAVLKTNIHRAYPNKISEFVGKYSAGCQVIKDPDDFKKFIHLVKTAIDWDMPNSFTYTLLNERDLT